MSDSPPVSLAGEGEERERERERERGRGGSTGKGRVGVKRGLCGAKEMRDGGIHWERQGGVSEWDG